MGPKEFMNRLKKNMSISYFIISSVVFAQAATTGAAGGIGSDFEGKIWYFTLNILGIWILFMSTVENPWSSLQFSLSELTAYAEN